MSVKGVAAGEVWAGSAGSCVAAEDLDDFRRAVTGTATDGRESAKVFRRFEVGGAGGGAAVSFGAGSGTN
jgi:hypothetical protein